MGSINKVVSDVPVLGGPWGEVFGSATNALGLTSPEVQRINQDAINQQIARLQGIQTGSVETPVMSQFKQASNQAMGNTLAGMAQAKGMRPSGQATMADITGSRMQGQAAQGAGVLGLQQQQQAGNLLSQMLLGQGGLSQAENLANLQSQQASAERLRKTIAGAGSAMAGA